MKRIIVAITGATGVIYGIRLLEALRDSGVESHLILSGQGAENIRHETERTVEDVKGLATIVHDENDLAASISSGSFRPDGMIVAPCTVKTLSARANSYNANLVARAADVVLKERRRLILAVRETPLHRGHLDLMRRVADMGGIILPPVPAFYFNPRTIGNWWTTPWARCWISWISIHSLFQRWKGQYETGPLKTVPDGW
jgi:4-hydroxy-3-polyprenylbenzoate decarboxylase